MDDAVLKAGTILAYTVCSVAVVVNLLVVVVFARTKHLQIKYFGFLFNLVLTDISTPLAAMVFIISQYHSTLSVALVRTSFLAGQLSILAVAVNRLLALSIVPPARYDAIVTWGRVALACALIWVVSALVYFPTSYLGGQDFKWLIQSLIPLAVLLGTGVLYYVVLRKIARYRPPLASTSGVRNNDEQTRTRVRQTRHYMVTFTIVLGACFLCWIPFCIAFLVLYFTNELTRPLRVYLEYTYAVLVLNSAINPFIYCWRIREYREGLYKLTGVWSGRRMDRAGERDQNEMETTQLAQTIGEPEM